jgi:hypothetical protein
LERWIPGSGIRIETRENGLNEIPGMIMKMARDSLRGVLELGEARIIAIESIQQASIQQLGQHVGH